MRDKNHKLIRNGRIFFELLAFTVVAGLSCLLPFAHYRYNGADYVLHGFHFLFGGSVCGGKVVYHPNYLLWISIASVVCIFLITILGKKIGAKTGGKLLLLFSIIIVVSTVVFYTQVKNILAGARQIGASYGILVALLAAAIILIESLVILSKEKYLSALDFMVLPGLVYILINNYIPMIGIFIAFKKIDYSKGIFASDWVGFDNFRYLFETKSAWIITRNTLLYNIVFIILGLTLGIIVGICLAELFSVFMRRVYQTTILLPQLISMVIIAYIGYAFLSNETGFINNALMDDDKFINFYGEKAYWPFILVFIQNWKMLGYNAIIFLASIVGIDRGLYEAARIDGAKKWAQITKITLPQLKPTIVTLSLLLVGRIFYSDFGLFYQVPLDSGALYNVTNTIDTFVYRSLMVSNNISTASAAGAYQAVVGFVIVFAVNMLVRKYDRENALF